MSRSTATHVFFINLNGRIMGIAIDLVNIIMRKIFTLFLSLSLSYCFAQSSSNIEPVDLGLPSGTKWANMNLGATKPSDIGDYFAWGEIEPKLDYTEESYKFYKSITTKVKDDDGFETSKTVSGFTKYVYAPKYAFEGVCDNKTELENEDDAAYQILGKEWNIPAVEQWKELISQCEWVEGKLNGKEGYKVIGPNGNWIFLPGTGYAYGERFLNIDIHLNKTYYVPQVFNSNIVIYSCKNLYEYEEFESDIKNLLYWGIEWNGLKWNHSMQSASLTGGNKGVSPYGLYTPNRLLIIHRCNGIPIRAVTNQNVSGIEQISENTESVKTIRKHIVNGKTVIDSGKNRYDINGTRIY